MASGDNAGSRRGRRGLGGESGEPVPVSIIDGQEDFFNSLKRALAIDPADRTGGSGDDFRIMVSSQQAMAQATREIAQEMKASVAMLRDLTVQLGSQHQQSMGQAAARGQLDRAQMDEMINVLRNSGGGGGGPRPGPGGGGGGHGGGGGYYGGIRGNLRAGAAAALNKKFPEAANAMRHGGARAAARKIPGLGPMVATGEAINEGATWLTGQRSKNAYYQSIYGGSNAGGLIGGLKEATGYGGGEITGGLGNRIAEEGFVLHNRFAPGGMTEDQSRESFKGVSQLGYTGQRRNESLDFIGEQYKKLGMDIQQSLSVVQLSAKYAQGNLGGVATQLQGVTKAAQATGQSAAQLQQAFIGNYQAALQGGAGGQAAGLAGAMTAVTGGAARDLGGFNFGGMFNNPTQKYAVGAQVGMTPGQVEAQASMGNLTPMLTGAQKVTTQYMSSVLGAGLQQKMEDLVNKAGGKAKVKASPGAMDNIALEMMSDRSWDIIGTKRALQSAGIDVPQDASDQQVAKLYVSWYVGNDFAAESQKNIDEHSIKPVAPQEMGAQNKDTGKMPGFSDFTSGAMNDAVKARNDAGTLGDVFGSAASDSSKTQMNSIQYYADYQKTHGNTSDPAMESLIKGFGSDPNARIRVQSKDGKDKAVTVADAIRYYGDQISTGTAYMMSENPDTNGKKLSELPGIAPDVGAKAGQGGLGDSAKSSTFGDDADQYAKDHGLDKTAPADTKAGAGDGKVTVSLQPDVAKLFQFSGTGVNIDSGPNARPPAPANGPK